MRILLIEDEKKTVAFLAKGLREAGFVTDAATDGEAGLNAARTKRFDLEIYQVYLNAFLLKRRIIRIVGERGKWFTLHRADSVECPLFLPFQ